MNRTEIETKAIEAIARALELDPESVTLEARIMADLGAESIDLLDITFRLERAFQIKIPDSELFQQKEKPGARMQVSDVVDYLSGREELR